ncbi:hypothetical protein QM312_35420 [Burkholderia cenocepacia]|uniref:hypothetical protein n=1 Tax=Burkholderia cenocepacia TaxID=95486 RepID=UPI0024B72A9D|nr:hypothetical protein [Burkholderia cenocepacia]MDI9701241.1 hypothetical protein [Burkholderia cenocepacia]
MEVSALDSSSTQNHTDFRVSKQCAPCSYIASRALFESLDEPYADQNDPHERHKNGHGEIKQHLTFAFNMPLVECANGEKHDKDRQKPNAYDN